MCLIQLATFINMLYAGKSWIYPNFTLLAQTWCLDIPLFLFDSDKIEQ